MNKPRLKVQGEPINRVSRHIESQNMSHNLFWNRSEIETKESFFVKIVMELSSSQKQMNKFSLEWTSSIFFFLKKETDLFWNRFERKIKGNNTIKVVFFFDGCCFRR